MSYNKVISSWSSILTIPDSNGLVIRPKNDVIPISRVFNRQHILQYAPFETGQLRHPSQHPGFEQYGHGDELPIKRVSNKAYTLICPFRSLASLGIQIQMALALPSLSLCVCSIFEGQWFGTGTRM